MVPYHFIGFGAIFFGYFAKRVNLNLFIYDAISGSELVNIMCLVIMGFISMVNYDLGGGILRDGEVDNNR